jgi:hypothetical protein
MLHPLALAITGSGLATFFASGLSQPPLIARICRFQGEKHVLKPLKPNRFELPSR